MIEIEQIDHIVLSVSDIKESVEFYTKVLDMKAEVFDDGRVALKFGNQKINLHERKNDFLKAKNPTLGSADLCFIIKTPIEEAMQYVKSCGVSIIEGIVKRKGATSLLHSFYFYDIDGNLIECSNKIKF